MILNDTKYNYITILETNNVHNDDPPINYNKVVVMGLGQLVLPVAKYVKEKGFDAYGYDIKEKAMDMAQTNYGIKKAINFGNFDVLIICVSTHGQMTCFPHK